MPEDNTAATPSIPPVDPSVTSVASDAPVSEPVSEPSPAPEPPVEPAPEPTPATPAESAPTDIPPIYADVAAKIRDSQNVLIALSSDPSVDEMATAIGLSLYLDKLGKRATAIYSGTTPNALEFLKPEDTFEPSADTLQDFVIAINKEKADHLRYKLDGDYVKIYITPYKTRISEEDLDFSYGDFNVDLVIALDVANGIDLDSALREHGRIMHDAAIINVTTSSPGKFGEIEWSDKAASSVAEMISKLLYSTNESDKIGKEEATAFLTGIVAATNRFSNASTSPETMQIASKLMKSGANQQLVSKNITPDVENQLLTINNKSSKEESSSATPVAKAKSKSESKSEPKSQVKAKPEPDLALESKDPSNLNISHHPEDESKQTESQEAPEGEEQPAEPEPAAEPTDSDNGLMDDLKAAEESLSHAGAETTPEDKGTSLQIDSKNESSNLDEITNGSEPTPQPLPEPQPAEASPTPEKVIQPEEDFSASDQALEDESKYGKMLEDALSEIQATPTQPETPIVTPPDNPAAMSAPAVPANPEINGVPEMNYMPLPDQEILPPPPAPPIDMSSLPPSGSPEVPPADFGTTLPSSEPTASTEPAAPVEPIAPATPPVSAPSTSPTEPTQPTVPAADPSAFKIPGM